jgi:tetrahydrodipicolinate N-succinyltransferase
MIVATLLFILLSPGLLLTFPPVGNRIFMTRKTSLTAIIIHTFIFAAVLTFSKSIPGLRSLEQFQDITDADIKTDTEITTERALQTKARQDLKKLHQTELKALLEKQKNERNTLRETQKTALLEKVTKVRERRASPRPSTTA